MLPVKLCCRPLSVKFGSRSLSIRSSRNYKHFFGPGLKKKKNVCHYCPIFHVCQVMVKPNQKITPALLVPVPVIGEPFEQVILDCVSPLPKTKSGNQFLLIMCSANQFPEAISIRKNDFCYYKMADQIISTFGLPKILQTDQGTDFLSKLFKQVIKLGGQ